MQTSNKLAEATISGCSRSSMEQQGYSEATDAHLKKLQEYFGYTSFRPMQWRIINAALMVLSHSCLGMI